MSLSNEACGDRSSDMISDIYATIRLLRKTAYDKLGDNTALHTYIMQPNVLETINSLHPYAISPYRDGWATKVKDPLSTKKDKRKLITAPTKEDIYIKLAEWYGMKNIDNLTLNDLYKQWLAYRKNTVENRNTVQRDEQHYRRYFAGTEFFNRTVTSIRRPQLKQFCCAVIRGETIRHTGKNSYTPGTHLTRKEWNNAKSILNGMFCYALDYEYITVNPLASMTFDKALFRIPEPKKKDTEIFNTEEEEALVSWCTEKFHETGDVSYLLPPLSLTIGTRIGECVALRWDDWTDIRHLVISKQEFLNRETRQLTVVDHTKTHCSRTLVLSKKAIKILNAIKMANPDSEWIFARNGERLTERQANYVLEKFAKDTGRPVKSSHKLRKTCGSNLYKQNGLTTKQCADYLGHSEKVFEEHYLFDTDTEEELMKKLDRVV